MYYDVFAFFISTKSVAKEVAYSSMRSNGFASRVQKHRLKWQLLWSENCSVKKLCYAAT